MAEEIGLNFPEDHAFMLLKLTSEQFDELEVKMLEAKKSPPKPGRPTRVSATQEQITSFMSAAQEVYDSELWAHAGRCYSVLYEQGVNWFPIIRPRLALCLAAMRQPEFFEHAKFGYETYPGDSDSYAAMAKMKFYAGQFSQALRWLDIALKASDDPHRDTLDLQQKLDWAVGACASNATFEQLSRFSRHSISTDKCLLDLNLVKKIDAWLLPKILDVEEWSKLDADTNLKAMISKNIEEQVERIRGDPSIIQEVRENNQEWRVVASVLFSLRQAAFPPKAASEEQLTGMKPAGGAFAQLSPEVFTKITYFVLADDLFRLEATCPLLREYVNHSQAWAITNFNNDYKFMIPGRPSPSPQWWKHLTRCRRATKKMSDALVGIMTGSSETSLPPFLDINMHALRNWLPDTDDFGLLSIDYPIICLVGSLNRLLSMDMTEATAQFHARRYLHLFLYMLHTPALTQGHAIVTSTLNVLASWIIRGGESTGRYAKALGFPAMLHVRVHDMPYEAGACLAAIEASQVLDNEAAVPLWTGKDAQEMESAEMQLSGIYHVVFVFDDPACSGMIERAVLNLDWKAGDEAKGTPPLIQGVGVDSMGAKFRFSTNPDSPPQPGPGGVPIEFQFTYDTKDSSKPKRLTCTGVAGACGFGGLFVQETDTPQPVYPGGPNFLGYWYMCRQRKPVQLELVQSIPTLPDSEQTSTSTLPLTSSPHSSYYSTWSTVEPAWNVLSANMLQEMPMIRRRNGGMRPWNPGYARPPIAEHVAGLRLLRYFYMCCASPAADFASLMSIQQEVPHLASAELEQIAQQHRGNYLSARGVAESQTSYLARENMLRKLLTLIIIQMTSITQEMKQFVPADVAALRGPDPRAAQAVQIKWLYLFSESKMDANTDCEGIASVLEMLLELPDPAQQRGNYDGPSEHTIREEEDYESDGEEDEESEEDDETESSFDRAIRRHERKLARRQARRQQGRASGKPKSKPSAPSKGFMSTGITIFLSATAVAVLAVGAFTLGRLLNKKQN